MTAEFHSHNSSGPDASVIDTMLEAASTVIRSELKTNFFPAVIFLEGMGKDKLIDTARHIPYYIQGVRRFRHILLSATDTGAKSKCSSSTDSTSGSEDTMKSGLTSSGKESRGPYRPVSSSRQVNAPALFPQTMSSLRLSPTMITSVGGMSQVEQI